MSSPDVLAAAQRLQQQDQPYALVTVLRVIAPASARPGDKAIVTADGIQQGWIGGGCAQPAVLRTVRQALADGRARMIRIAPSEQGEVRELDDVLEFGMACHSGGTLELFIDPMLPRARLTVIGDSPLAAALAGLAPRVGLPVTVVAHAADAARFPDAERVLSSDDPAAAAAEVAPGSFVVVATQGRRDLQGLRAALALQARGVFFVASARKAMVLKESLAEAGQDAAAVAAIVAPAGQPIGAQTPEEIALSVLAAVVAARRGAHASSSAPSSAPSLAPSLASTAVASANPASDRPGLPARKPLPLPELPAIAGSCCGGAEPAAVAETAAAAAAVVVAAPKSCCGG
jgi:xanthine dehydrogenase accessory factor